MIIVRVELHSAVTQQVTELARMMIANKGSGTLTHGDYSAVVYRGRSKQALDRQVEQKRGEIDHFPRQSLHVWNLVARALARMGYA